MPSNLQRDGLINILSGNQEPPPPPQAMVAAKTPIEAVVQSAFLSPLKGESAELCKIGHQMEPIYAENLLKAGKDGIKLQDGKVLIIHHLYRAGLLQKTGSKYQKDSPDFILIGTLDGEPLVAVVEMKARCKTKTQEAERRRVNFGEFASVSCRSPDLRKFLLNRGEALQNAHHASTLSLNHVLFVTGDRISMTGGVLIHYDNDFLSSYNKCIDDIYESGLKWAYEAESEEEMPIEELRAAVAIASVPLDFDTLMKHFYFWKELTRDENLPLPPCERILPMQDALWNVTKHGSDVKTQACQSMSTNLPVDTPGAKAFDRMQMNMFADIHKGSQMFLVQENLAAYSNLERFRNEASRELTFRKCMIKMSKIFLSVAHGESGESECNGGSSNAASFVTPTQNGAYGQSGRHVPNTSSLRRKTKDVSLSSKVTGLSPKRNALKRFMTPRQRVIVLSPNDLRAALDVLFSVLVKKTGNSRVQEDKARVFCAIERRIGTALSATAGAVMMFRSPLDQSIFGTSTPTRVKGMCNVTSLADTRAFLSAILVSSSWMAK